MKISKMVVIFSLVLGLLAALLINNYSSDSEIVIIHLRNGQKIKGYHLKSWSSGFTTLELLDGKSIQYKTSDIVKLEYQR